MHRITRINRTEVELFRISDWQIAGDLDEPGVLLPQLNVLLSGAQGEEAADCDDQEQDDIQ